MERNREGITCNAQQGTNQNRTIPSQVNRDFQLLAPVSVISDSTVGARITKHGSEISPEQ